MQELPRQPVRDKAGNPLPSLVVPPLPLPVTSHIHHATPHRTTPQHTTPPPTWLPSRSQRQHRTQIKSALAPTVLVQALWSQFYCELHSAAPAPAVEYLTAASTVTEYAANDTAGTTVHQLQCGDILSAACGESTVHAQHSAGRTDRHSHLFTRAQAFTFK